MTWSMAIGGGITDTPQKSNISPRDTIQLDILSQQKERQHSVDYISTQMNL